jgi:surfactin synthase thioesterase subunit
MGASFAHEVALALAGVSASVEHLVISARPPADRARVLGLADLSDEELRASIQSLAEGANPLDNDELWLVALPTIRTDAQCLQAYRRPLLPILDAPVTAIGGTLDRDADEATMAEWSSATRGPFQVRMLEGGHFYLDNAADAVISIVLHAPTSRYIHA